MLRRGCGTATLLAAMTMATADAGAASPVVLDPAGRDPHGIVDDAGTLRVVWRRRGDDGVSSLLTCTVVRSTGNGCSGPPQVLGLPAAEPTLKVPIERPFAYRAGATTRIVQTGWAGGRTYVWTADAEGVFGPATLEAQNGPTVGTSSPGVQEGDRLVTQHETRVQGITFSPNVESSFATLSDPGGTTPEDTDLERVPGPAGAYVASSLDVLEGRSVYWVNDLGSGVNTSANWKPHAPFPSPGVVEMASGPLGLFAVTASGTATPLRAHRWTGSGWDAGVELPVVVGAPRLDVVQAGGRLWVLAATPVDADRVALTLTSSADGLTWSAPSTVEVVPFLLRNLRLAVAPDGQGFAVWDVLGQPGASVTDLRPLPPAPGPPASVPPTPGPPPPAPLPPAVPPTVPKASGPGSIFAGARSTTTRRREGSKLTVTGPAACVPRDRRFVASVVIRGGRVRPSRVTFGLTSTSGVPAPGPHKRVVDRKAPYGTTSLTTSTLVRGRTYRLRVAVRYRTKGRRDLGVRTVTIIRPLRVCR